MKNRIILIAAVVACIAGITRCGGNPKVEADYTISHIDLEEKEIEITLMLSTPEFVLGTDFARKETYIKSQEKPGKKIFIQVIDTETGAIKKEFPLRMGDFQSPTDFYNPTYMEFLEGKYYIVDQMEKIVVFDSDFNHLYSDMFSKDRCFLDIFQDDGRVFFAIGTRELLPDAYKCEVQLYLLEENRKPVLNKNLYKTDIKRISSRDKNGTAFFHGVLSPFTDGFVKGKELFYTSMTENRLYVYNFKTGQTTAVELSYLTPKTYSEKDAARFGFYKSDGWEERFFKTEKRKIVYLPYPGPVYHFGIHDVGINKIGVVGDIDLVQMKFRLDIIDSTSYNYLESLRFPIGVGFLIKISKSNRGFINNYFDIDNGIYVWEDIEGEDFDYVTKITKFKVKESGGGNEN